LTCDQPIRAKRKCCSRAEERISDALARVKLSHELIHHPTCATKRATKDAQITKRRWCGTRPDARARRIENSLCDLRISGNSDATSGTANINAAPCNGEPGADHRSQAIVGS
jgi:hypothetical protein